MSGLESNFSTAILTSRTPNQSALIVNEGIKQSNFLLKDNFIKFFNGYCNLLQKQNHDLNQFLESNAVPVISLLNSDKEFGMMNKAFENYVQTIKSQVNFNDQTIKYLKLEVLNPLIDFINNDILYNELLINNQELIEITGIQPFNEYQWNVKSVETFDNFGDFKRKEKNLIIQGLINLLNLQNGNLDKAVKFNESSLQYCLNNYNLDTEMDNYLNILLTKNTPPLRPVDNASLKSQPLSKNKGPSVQPYTSSSLSNRNPSRRQSKLLNSSTAESSGSKRNSKLRSKVGSIFGRKKSKDKLSEMNGISETQSLYSTNTTNTNMTQMTQLNKTEEQPLPKARTNTVSSNDKLKSRSSSLRSGSSNYNPSIKHTDPNKSMEDLTPPTRQTSTNTPLKSSPLAHTNHDNELDPIQGTPPRPAKSDSFDNSSSRAPPLAGNNDRDLPILPVEPSPFSPQPSAAESPNVVKYSDASSDSSAESMTAKNRLSMLQQHDLDNLQPPGMNNDLLNVSKSRQTQYSFESGDDLKPIATSPKVQKNEKFELPEPDLEGNKSQQPSFQQQFPPEYQPIGTTSDQLASKQPIEQQHHTSGPTPPPARKVVHNENKKRTNINSQMFHSLPNSRESVIAPSNSVPLTNQATGNSLNKPELFNHLELSTTLVEGLNASNSQVINVNFKQESLAKSSIIGEIAFNYIGDSIEPFLIELPNKFDKLIANNSLLEQISDKDFKVNPALIKNKTLGGIKYMENNLSLEQIPIFVYSVWKYEDHQASLMINVKLNENYSPQIILNNLVVSVALDNSVSVSSVSSRPQGTFNKDKNRITWRFTNLIQLTSERPEERLIARFMTSGKGREDDSGIQLKFSIQNSASNVQLLTDQRNSNLINNLVSGNYTANS